MEHSILGIIIISEEQSSEKWSFPEMSKVADYHHGGWILRENACSGNHGGLYYQTVQHPRQNAIC